MEKFTQKKRQIPNSIKRDIINELKCKICNGIIRDCNGISECFHMFCNNCINEYLNKYKDNTIIRCPFCHKVWGNYKDCKSMKIKIYNIDNIIDIIFPQLEKENKKAKKEFFKNLEKAKEELNNENIKNEKINSIQILLKPLLNVDNPKEILPQIKNNFIEVKMTTTFSDIKKSICKKLGRDLNYTQIILHKQGLPIDDTFTDIQSYCLFDKNFDKSDERVLFYSKKIDF